VQVGQLWLEPVTAGQLVMALAGKADKHQHDPEIQRRASLTPKEHCIISVLVSHPGDRTKELANRLHISEHTLRNHLSQIYSKLEVSNRLELFAYASHSGLGSSPN
jgi:DNA-binding NarL/FixJ family response regulator